MPRPRQPKGPPKRPLTEPYTMMFTAEEKLWLTTLAIEHHQSMADILRRLLREAWQAREA